jgi:hypothetical protein
MTSSRTVDGAWRDHAAKEKSRIALRPRVARSSLVVMALVGAGALNVGFYSLVSASIAPRLHHAFIRLIFLVVGATVPFDALVVLVARRRATLTDTETELDWRPLARRAVVLASVLASVLVIGITARRSNFAYVSPTCLLLAASYLVVRAAGVVPKGVLAGRGDTGAFAVAVFVRLGGRICCFACLNFVGTGIAGAFAALTAAELASTAIIRIAAHRHAGPSIPMTLAPSEWLRATLALAALLFALPTVEAVVAGRYLPTWQYDHYAAAINLARATAIVPQLVALVMLPSFLAGGAAAREALRSTLRIASLASLTVTALAVICSPWISLRALGSDPSFFVPTLLVTALSAWALGLLTVMVIYHLARGLPTAGTVWAAVGATLAAAWWWHTGPVAIVAVFATVCLGALARYLVGPSLRGAACEWGAGERRQPAREKSDIDLTVVVPFFNPGAATLKAHLTNLVETLQHEDMTFEVIAVSDGSTDGSDRLARELEPLGVRTIELDRNRGKGAALRAGLREGQGRYLGFVDADGDIPPEMWHTFVSLLALYNADMIVGSKHHALSQLHYPPLRRVYSRVFQVLVHALFRIGVTDTQTGIKVFRRELLEDVLPLLVENGFVFDLELLVVARRRGWRRVLEAPVQIHHRFTSTISLRSVVYMVRDCASLATRLYLTRSYDTPAAAPTAAPSPPIIELVGAA